MIAAAGIVFEPGFSPDVTQFWRDNRWQRTGVNFDAFRVKRAAAPDLNPRRWISFLRVSGG